MKITFIPTSIVRCLADICRTYVQTYVGHISLFYVFTSKGPFFIALHGFLGNPVYTQDFGRGAPNFYILISKYLKILMRYTAMKGKLK